MRLVVLLGCLLSAMCWAGGAFHYDDSSHRCIDGAGNTGLNPKNLGDCGDLKGYDFVGYAANFAADAQHQILAGMSLNGADLTGADLHGQSFVGTQLNDANLSGVDLRGAMLKVTELDRANLKGAKFDATTKFPDSWTRQTAEARGMVFVDPQPATQNQSTGPSSVVVGSQDPKDVAAPDAGKDNPSGSSGSQTQTK